MCQCYNNNSHPLTIYLCVPKALQPYNASASPLQWSVQKHKLVLTLAALLPVLGVQKDQTLPVDQEQAGVRDCLDLARLQVGGVAEPPRRAARQAAGGAIRVGLLAHGGDVLVALGHHAVLLVLQEEVVTLDVLCRLAGFLVV